MEKVIFKDNIWYIFTSIFFLRVCVCVGLHLYSLTIIVNNLCVGEHDTILQVDKKRVLSVMRGSLYKVDLPAFPDLACKSSQCWDFEYYLSDDASAIMDRSYVMCMFMNRLIWLCVY